MNHINFILCEILKGYLFIEIAFYGFLNEGKLIYKTVSTTKIKI